mmetsp:Transcript_15900/g.32007  ORF Transcript_15900/g.32007 Transcript_15900/m.32007 type:complete len:82 (+) Transcript_15900:387-632(+)
MCAIGAAIIGPRYIHCGTRMVDVSSTACTGKGEEGVSLTTTPVDVVVLRGNTSSCDGPSSNVCLAMVGYTLLATASLFVEN